MALGCEEELLIQQEELFLLVCIQGDWISDDDGRGDAVKGRGVVCR